jgi:DNA-binding NarL/FixJ family response regulator
MTTPINIAVTGDYQLSCEAMSHLLLTNNNLNLLFNCDFNEQILDKLKTSKPDILIVYLDSPVNEFMSLIHLLKQVSPSIKPILITPFVDAASQILLIKSGIMSIVLKKTGFKSLLNIIYQVKQQETFVNQDLDEISTKIDQSNFISNQSNDSTHLCYNLTQRELDILFLLTGNTTNKQIAHVLSISVRTVEGHRSSLIKKIGTHSPVQIALIAKELNDKINPGKRPT